jgi:hypothetical protein
MSGMKSKGGRRGSRGPSARGGAARSSRPAPGTAPEPAASSGSSRIRLTHILRDGAIWQVFIVTTSGPGPTAAVLLEFERTGGAGEPDRHATPLTGRLRDALYDGGPVSRADLVRELDRALQTGAA